MLTSAYITCVYKLFTSQSHFRHVDLIALTVSSELYTHLSFLFLQSSELSTMPISQQLCCYICMRRALHVRRAKNNIHFLAITHYKLQRVGTIRKLCKYFLDAACLSRTMGSSRLLSNLSRPSCLFSALSKNPVLRGRSRVF